PRCCIQRAPPPSPTVVVHEILQWGPHASIPGERCAGLARRRSRRAHSLSPNLGRTASPICPDLIYDRHTQNSRNPFHAGFAFRGFTGSLPLRPARLLAPLYGSDWIAQPSGTFTSRLSTDQSPFPLPDITTTVAGSPSVGGPCTRWNGS